MVLWGKGSRKDNRSVIAAPVISELSDAPKRDKQLNLKVSDDCRAVFVEIARLEGLSAAALFEDMVAERAEALEKAGRLDIKMR